MADAFYILDAPCLADVDKRAARPSPRLTLPEPLTPSPRPKPLELEIPLRCSMLHQTHTTYAHPAAKGVYRAHAPSAFGQSR